MSICWNSPVASCHGLQIVAVTFVRTSVVAVMLIWPALDSNPNQRWTILTLLYTMSTAFTFQSRDSLPIKLIPTPPMEQKPQKPLCKLQSGYWSGHTPAFELKRNMTRRQGCMRITDQKISSMKLKVAYSCCVDCPCWRHWRILAVCSEESDLKIQVWVEEIWKIKTK